MLAFGEVLADELRAEPQDRQGAAQGPGLGTLAVVGELGPIPTFVSRRAN